MHITSTFHILLPTSAQSADIVPMLVQLHIVLLLSHLAMLTSFLILCQESHVTHVHACPMRSLPRQYGIMRLGTDHEPVLMTRISTNYVEDCPLLLA